MVWLRAYSWLYVKASLLVVLRKPDGMPEIKPVLAVCKSRALPVVWP